MVKKIVLTIPVEEDMTSPIVPPHMPPSVIWPTPNIPKPSGEYKWSKSISNLGWDDFPPVGRHKFGGEEPLKIRELFDSRPDYLLWMRDKCLESKNETGGFTMQVHEALNGVRAKKKNLAKHRHYDLSNPGVIIEAETAQLTVKYDGWGSW